MSSQPQFSQTTALLPGMIVRFPVDVDEDPADFRRFLIGRVERADPDADSVAISALIYELQESTTSREVTMAATSKPYERPAEQVARCRILADSPFRYACDPRRTGRVLAPCDESPPPGVHLDYFVEVEGKTLRLSEAEIVVGAHRQDPDPLAQALSYELHSPSWKTPRDRVVETFGELRSATFGIESLVGSRVFLMSHQAEVVTRVLSSPECRFMLADEVGLGKTIEASVIFKALRRRDAALRALIVTPASLTHQWRNELNRKFWLDLPIVSLKQGLQSDSAHPGFIISAEELAAQDADWQTLARQQWGLLIIDEAHHLRKSDVLYNRICRLSALVERVLVLTATPIQRRVGEYLSLLRVLDPRRYASETEESFRRLVEAQEPVRKAITLTRPLLDRDDIDVEELVDELSPLRKILGDDSALMDMIGGLEDLDDSLQEAADLARQIVSYVSANYRIEGRTIRNRRASISASLPRRTRDITYSYHPSAPEERLLEDLYDYAQGYLRAAGTSALTLEYVRSLLHAAASSPDVLCDLLGWRIESIRTGEPPLDAAALIGAPAPRQVERRLRQVVSAAPAPAEDLGAVERLAASAEVWSASAPPLDGLRLSAMGRPSQDRLVECARAVYQAVEGRAAAKVLVFVGWTKTAARLTAGLRRLLGVGAVAQFTADMDDVSLQDSADSFQSSDECCVLVCDELGGEGRNFQIADRIIHVDIPWTPAQLEQRIGRVDRIGRAGEVLSVPIFARDTVEHQLFRLWNEALGLFTRSMSGLEIALEATQDEIMGALGRSVRDGLTELLQPLRLQAAELREAVEKELLYDKEGDDKALRRQFDKLSDTYRDGKVLRKAVHQWTSMAGLANFQIEGDTMVYNAQRFSIKAMEQSGFLPPNMEEAARRSGNRRTTRIVGTFTRDVAVRREDLVFFAPGDDPWTDAVVTNAIECFRGRCCAVGFPTSLTAGGPFFELLYSFHIGPRELYEAGLPSIYLLLAQSYLPRPHKRLLVGVDDQLIHSNDPRWQLASRPFKQSPFKHLGRRTKQRGGESALDLFRRRYPPDAWAELVRSCLDVAARHIQEDVVEYAAELAEEAHQAFQLRVRGWEASIRWQRRNGADVPDDLALEQYRRAVEALVAGIRRPTCRLESICFWEPVEG